MWVCRSLLKIKRTYEKKKKKKKKKKQKKKRKIRMEVKSNESETSVQKCARYGCANFTEYSVYLKTVNSTDASHRFEDIVESYKIKLHKQIGSACALPRLTSFKNFWKLHYTEENIKRILKTLVNSAFSKEDAAYIHGRVAQDLGDSEGNPLEIEQEELTNRGHQIDTWYYHQLVDSSRHAHESGSIDVAAVSGGVGSSAPARSGPESEEPQAGLRRSGRRRTVPQKFSNGANSLGGRGANRGGANRRGGGRRSRPEGVAPLEEKALRPVNTLADPDQATVDRYEADANRKFCKYHRSAEPLVHRNFEDWLKLHNGDDHSRRVRQLVEQLFTAHRLTHRTFESEEDLLSFIYKFSRTQSTELKELLPEHLVDPDSLDLSPSEPIQDVLRASDSSVNTVNKLVNAARLYSRFLNYDYQQVERFCRKLSTRTKNYEEGFHLLILYDFNTTLHIYETIATRMNQLGEELTLCANLHEVVPKIQLYYYLPQVAFLTDLNWPTFIVDYIFTYANLLTNIWIAPVSLAENSRLFKCSGGGYKIQNKVGNRSGDFPQPVEYKVPPEYEILFTSLQKMYRTTNRHTQKPADPIFENEFKKVTKANKYEKLGLPEQVVRFLKSHLRTFCAAIHTYRESDANDPFPNVKLFTTYLLRANVGVATSQFNSYYKGLQAAGELNKAIDAFKDDLAIAKPDLALEMKSRSTDLDPKKIFTFPLDGVQSS
jgi:hypothetical protein